MTAAEAIATLRFVQREIEYSCDVDRLHALGREIGIAVAVLEADAMTERWVERKEREMEKA